MCDKKTGNVAQLQLAVASRQRACSHFPQDDVVAPHFLSSSDLVPSDFALFSRMKRKLKGLCFDAINEVQTESQMLFYSLLENYLCAFEAWKTRWDLCILSILDYTEADGDQI